MSGINPRYNREAAKSGIGKRLAIRGIRGLTRGLQRPGRVLSRGSKRPATLADMPSQDNLDPLYNPLKPGWRRGRLDEEGFYIAVWRPPSEEPLAVEGRIGQYR